MALKVRRRSFWTGEKRPLTATASWTSSPAPPHIKGYAASEVEKAAVIRDARMGASASVARTVEMFGGAMLKVAER